MQQAKSVRREKTDKHADNQTKETKPQMIMHEILCLDIGKPLCKERQTKQTDRNGGSGGGGGICHVYNYNGTSQQVLGPERYVGGQSYRHTAWQKDRKRGS